MLTFKFLDQEREHMILCKKYWN